MVLAYAEYEGCLKKMERERGDPAHPQRKIYKRFKTVIFIGVKFNIG